MAVKNKRVLVTGGAGALGRIVCARFLREGAIVASSYRTESERISLSDFLQGKLLFLKADVTDEEDVKNMFDKVVREHGGIDILVNTVGGFAPTKLLPEVSADEWDRMMELNLLSTFLCTREALRKMKGNSYGRIINISAKVGISPSAGRVPYAISKAGVNLLTETVAQELKGTGVTINAIAPSIIDTAANRESMPDENHSKWVRPETIADMIVYLCSDEARQISGTIIKAYGDV
jgi:NAD(P)-dependent dehydrogenase (short-subunit alcohol dehydrogenase family)